MLLCRPAGDAPIHLVQLRPPVAQPNPVRSPWGCLSCVLGSTPSCRRYRLLVWPGACLDLAVHLHELLVFQAFFANENSFRLKKTLFIKKKKKIKSSILLVDLCLEELGRGMGRGRSPNPSDGDAPGTLAASPRGGRCSAWRLHGNWEVLWLPCPKARASFLCPRRM